MTALLMEPVAGIEGRWIRYAAVILSLLLHGFLLASYGGVSANTTPEPKQPVIQVSFLEPAPEPVKAPEVVPEIKPEKTIAKPKPVSKPDPKPVQKVAKKAVVKKAAMKKMTAPIPRVVEEVISEPVMVAAAPPITVSVAEPQIDDGLIKRETERYIAELMAHIEQYKWYPKAARRRGIEGEVIVRFTLYPDGTAHQLSVESGPSMLLAAARRAVERAMPMPIPPETIHCPLECQFRMAFHLKRS